MSAKFCVNVLLVTLVLFHVSAASLEKYCSENRFRTRGNILQFTKELSSAEYAVSNTTTKILYCCTKGYRSIEWFKDGRPYPWTLGVSSLILNPDSANQSIYTQRLIHEDAGLYTCRASNETHLIEHHIKLTILQSSSYVDEPKPTYRVPEAHFTRINEPARLYCEAFVGRNDLPDEMNTITWSRPGVNMTALLAEDRINTTVVYRDNLQIIGSYFLIEKVKLADFGDYFCSISNSDDQFITLNTSLREIDWVEGRRRMDIPSWAKIVIPLIACCFYLLLTFENKLISFGLLVFYTLANFLKRYFLSFNNTSNRKEYDVMIGYKRADKEFAVDTLASKLKNEHNYKVICKELHDPTMRTTSCNAIILVISPATFNNTWTPTVISRSIAQVHAINNRVVLIPSKALPSIENLKTAEADELIQWLKRIRFVDGNRFVNGKLRVFWAKLIYVLPLAQSQPGYTVSATNSPNKIKMQRTGSTNGAGGILV